jgi:hypothetical protein
MVNKTMSFVSVFSLQNRNERVILNAENNEVTLLALGPSCNGGRPSDFITAIIHPVEINS